MNACPSLVSDGVIRALVVSDVHDDILGVERLKAWLVSQDLIEHIDLILSPGDLSTAPQTGVNEEEYESKALAVLEALASIGRDVYYVPGNHDPLALFNNVTTAVRGSLSGARLVNVHSRILPLAPGLSIGGWGGSSTASTVTEPHLWPGWPYDEATNARGYERLHASIEAAGREADSLLLLPHCGPAESGTTAVTGPDPNNLTRAGVRPDRIESGSYILRQFLSDGVVQVTLFLLDELLVHRSALPLALSDCHRPSPMTIDALCSSLSADAHHRRGAWAHTSRSRLLSPRHDTDPQSGLSAVRQPLRTAPPHARRIPSHG